MTVPEISKRAERILPWLISMAFFMQMLDGTIVNTALPAIARDLGENPLKMQSVVIAYLITVAMLIPASGWLADRFGTKRIFLAAIILFTLGSLACGISQTLPQLVLSRVLQGIGGAMLVPVGRLILLRSYPRRRLIKVLSFVTIPALIGPLLGPAAGGFMVEYISWHWIFLINVPVGIAGFILSIRFMLDIREDRCSKFDISGFILFSAAMVLISLGLDGVQSKISAEAVMGLIGGGIACFAIYWIKSHFSIAPIFSPNMFKIDTFTIGIIGNLVTRLGTGAMPLLIPLLLQVVMQYSPSQAGMLMISTSLASLTARLAITPLIRRFGYRKVLTLNTIALGLIICFFACIGSQPSVYLLIALFMVMGMINAAQFTAMNTLTLIDLPDNFTAGGNSLLSVVLQLSVSLGVSAAAALLHGFESLLDMTETALIDAFNYTFLCIGLFTLLGSIAFFRIHSDCGKRTRLKK